MQTLGGSLFIRNAIQYDYCVEESILSIVDLCKQIIVLDCQSNDGTTYKLRRFVKSYPHIRLIENVNWNCAPNYERLQVLANLAISFLKTDWHIMIQADEVLHEKSIPAIRQILASPMNADTAVAMRRPHVFGNMDHYIRHDLETERKPASDKVVRLGRINHLAVGDAESLLAPNIDWNHTDDLVLFHYGYVRKNAINIQKVIDMQTWFYGPNANKIDPRILKMKNTDNIYRPEAFFSWDELTRLDLSHPKVAEKWVNVRRGDYPFNPP